MLHNKNGKLIPYIIPEDQILTEVNPPQVLEYYYRDMWIEVMAKYKETYIISQEMDKPDDIPEPTNTLGLYEMSKKYVKYTAPLPPEPIQHKPTTQADWQPTRHTWSHTTYRGD